MKNNPSNLPTKSEKNENTARPNSFNAADDDFLANDTQNEQSVDLNKDNQQQPDAADIDDDFLSDNDNDADNPDRRNL